MDIIKISFKSLNTDAKLPTKAHSNDTGWDVYCIDNVDIKPGESKIVPVGLQLAYITPGYWIQVACRSGLGFKHNLAVHPGVIDEGYRGSLDILFRNFDLSKTHSFKKGDKVAQLIVYKNIETLVEWTDQVSETTRGEKGFGSSDKPAKADEVYNKKMGGATPTEVEIVADPDGGFSVKPKKK